MLRLAKLLATTAVAGPGFGTTPAIIERIASSSSACLFCRHAPKPVPFLSGLGLLARWARTTNIHAMSNELFAARRTCLGADGNSMAARHCYDRMLFARRSTDPMKNTTLEAGISVFGDDRLNAILRPSIEIDRPPRRRLERPICSFLEADDEEPATMICKGNNFLRDHGAVIIVGEVKPLFDLHVQCFTRLVY